jgi:ATP-binding cassette subfamily B protein
VVDTGTHEELMARCRLYRLLLAGPGTGIEDVASEEEETPAPAGGVTPAAWAGAGEAPKARVEVPAASGAGGGPGDRMAMVSATPELLAKVAALPPAADRPHIDVARESRRTADFTLGRFVRPYRLALGLGMALVVLDALANLAGPALVRRGLDQGVVGGSSSALWATTALFAGVVLTDWVVVWAQQRYTGRTAERLLFALRIRIFAHLQRLGMDFYEREMAGRIMTRMTTDVESLSTLLQNGLIQAIVSLLTLSGVAVVLLVMNPALSLATYTVLLPLVVATIVFRRLSNRAYGTARERIGTVNASLQESVSGVRVAQAYGRQDRNIEQFREVAKDHLDARIRAQRLVATYFPFVEMLSEIAAAVVLGVGAGLIGDGGLTSGELVAFLLYLNLLFAPIQQLSQVFDTYQQARASVSQIEKLLLTDPSVEEPALPVDPGRLRGAIRFEGVRFSYPGVAEEALSGVDLDIAPGESVALVGETGAGKSTVLKLLARFYDPTAGRVLVDGHPLTELDSAAYRRQLGYVPQEAFLFSGTVRDNIAYGRPDATDAEVEEAALAVGAHPFIAGLAGGYLHPVTERGRSLSAGQRQLIALARARLVDPAILLLDEATSTLDLASEARVTRAMSAVAEGRTTLLIAHRLQTAQGADRIVVIDRGRAVEEGTHDDLLRRGGRYAAMWRAFEGGPPALTEQPSPAPR